ncbi:MAG: Ig-like domain-containing protein [Bacteroidales bacterium]|nr:Ig-like domain-containing protein [Bacteroidales bacterium]
MKKSLFLGLIGASVLFVSCVHDIQEVVPMIRGGLTLTAVTEQPAATRTAVESGTQVWWEPGDSIKVFCGSQAACFVSDLSERVAQADFVLAQKGFTIGETDSLWALYPYAEEAVFDGQAVTTTLPSTQVARAGSFGKNMNLSLARTTGRTLQFYNVGGGIRFTVTEEGIKKVIFEGLGGESISGKVKIGFDESGIPVVQEVVGGSQFITLLPPEGEDAFQKDTWYYLVAIPGALEKGYKLRFYKDTDYARKVSEKVAQIKRSIYGSLDKADERIEYAPKTTHFPETKEDWEESITLTEDITEAIAQIKKTSHPGNTSELLNEISKLDGVLSVSLSESEDVAYIQQMDSSYLNFFLTPEESSNVLLSPDESSALSTVITSVQTRKQKSILEPSSKKAILLAPFQSAKTRAITVQIGLLEDLLACADFSLNPVVNNKADMSQFELKNLCQYDLVLIRSHGVSNAKTNKGDITTAISSGQPVDHIFVSSVSDYIKNRVFGDMGRCIVTTSDDIVGPNYCLTVPWLEKQKEESASRFPGSIIYAGACQSFMDDDLKQCFFDLEAYAYGGFTESVAGGVADTGMYRIMNLMTQGTGFKYASSYFNSNDVEGDLIRNYLISTNNGIDDPSYSHKLYNHETNPKIDVSDYYLLDSTPGNLHFETSGTSMIFSWTVARPQSYTGQSSFWDPENAYTPILELPCFYDIYLDKQFVKTVENECQCILPYVSPGPHKWYIVSRIMNGDGLCASFQSSEKDFTVPEGIRVESISLDKTELELAIGCTATLTATVLPENASNKNVSWSSDNESVATVSSNGEVKGIAKGNAIITVKTEDGDKTATCIVTVKEDAPYSCSVPEIIDLGLPSGLKWASFNLGASKPEEYGDYFAWGETEPYYKSLDPLTWKPGKEAGYDWSSYKWRDGSTITKYRNGSSSTGVSETLDLEDDAAHVAFGGNWRMPTVEEEQELVNQCTWEWISMNGVEGLKATGPNGSSIFLPASGCIKKLEFEEAGTWGSCWSSSIGRYNIYGKSLSIRSTRAGCYDNDRCLGLSIRPVYSANSSSPGGDIEGTEREPWN